MISSLLALVIAFSVIKFWGGPGLAVLLVILFIIHVGYRLRTGRWME